MLLSEGALFRIFSVVLQRAFRKTIPAVLIIFFFLSTSASAVSIWDIGSNEEKLEGILLSCRGERVLLQTTSGIKVLSFSDKPFTAISGSFSGYVVSPADFPLLIRVELILDFQGKVRAMRNINEVIITPDGQKLNVSGHEVRMSPTGENYLLYQIGSGLHLYSAEIADLGKTVDLTEPTDLSETAYSNAATSLPGRLSNSPLAAWSPCGRKIACCNGDFLSIYDLDRCSHTTLPLPAVEEGLVRVLTDLVWSPDGKKLMYTSLEDQPNLGSEVFFLKIIDLKGRILHTKPVINLIKAYWRTKENINIISVSNLSFDFLGAFDWDLRTNITSRLLSIQQGFFRNTAYNPFTDCLAYTKTTGYAEDIYLVNLRQLKPVRIISLPFPLRNLQWSKNKTLLFYEELNGIIYEVSPQDSMDDWQLSAQAAGYLPPHGASLQAGKFVFFEAEPFEEPQPLFINE